MRTLTSSQPLGDIYTIVEYEYTEAEREQGPESRAAGPGYAASVVVTRVNVCNAEGYGCWVDAEAFNADVVALWEENILKEHQS